MKDLPLEPGDLISLNSGALRFSDKLGNTPMEDVETILYTEGKILMFLEWNELIESDDNSWTMKALDGDKIVRSWTAYPKEKLDQFYTKIEV